jgi:hypothetical protein
LSSIIIVANETDDKEERFGGLNEDSTAEVLESAPYSIADIF